MVNLKRIDIILVDDQDKVVANMSTTSDSETILINLYQELAQKMVDALIEDLNNLPP